MPPVTRVNVPEFWDRGYLHIRNLFSKDEIQEMRRHGFADRQRRADLLAHPYLRKALLDDRILDIAARILGDTPVYYGDSTFNVGQFSWDWHKDNPDRDVDGPDWNGRYTQIRFAIYMEDHAWHSGGLRLIPGSHHALSTPDGKPKNVRTRIGDVVVWNQRLTHAGSAMMLRLFPWVFIELQDWALRTYYASPQASFSYHRLPIIRPFAMRIPRFCFASEAMERGFLSFGLGLQDAHMERYIAYSMTRAYAIELWKNSEYGDDVWAAVRGKNIKVIDVGAEVRRRLAAGDTSLGVNAGHKPIPAHVPELVEVVRGVAVSSPGARPDTPCMHVESTGSGT
jgi:hypothetical protein